MQNKFEIQLANVSVIVPYYDIIIQFGMGADFS